MIGERKTRRRRIIGGLIGLSGCAVLAPPDNRPGQDPFRPDMTVLTAISIAGGFTDRAAQSYVGVTRDHSSVPAEYRAPLFALAQPGDVITVFERRF
jgi:hypothetical protein